MRLLICAVLVAAASAAPAPEAEADPQYIVSPYVSTYPGVSTYPYMPTTQYVQPQVVPQASYVQAAPQMVPTTYAANPGFFEQLPQGGGKYLPGVFGWDRGSDHFKKWNTVPVPLRANRVKWRTDGQRMSNGFNSASGADPNKFTDKYSNPGSYQGRKKRDAEADPQYFATQFVDPMTGAVGYYPVMPTTQYVQPQMVPQASYVQAAPQMVPTTYAANPVADPMFFNFGRYFNNNIGGKADYGHEAGRRKYPSYGDYYRTHRYPLNDGWMKWDEDLRDKDTAKAGKIGFGKDGGR